MSKTVLLTDRYWQGKSKVLGEKLVLMHLRLPQILHWLVWDPARIFALISTCWFRCELIGYSKLQDKLHCLKYSYHFFTFPPQIIGKICTTATETSEGWVANSAQNHVSSLFCYTLTPTLSQWIAFITYILGHTWWSIPLFRAYRDRLPRRMYAHKRKWIQIDQSILEPTLKAKRGVQAYLYSFFNLGAWRGGGVNATLQPIYASGKRNGTQHWRLGRPQGRSARVRKISAQTRFDPRTAKSLASRYTKYDTPAHGNIDRLQKIT
jgi:hypothetical protein